MLFRSILDWRGHCQGLMSLTHQSNPLKQLISRLTRRCQMLAVAEVQTLSMELLQFLDTLNSRFRARCMYHLQLVRYRLEMLGLG